MRYSWTWSAPTLGRILFPKSLLVWQDHHSHSGTWEMWETWLAVKTETKNLSCCFLPVRWSSSSHSSEGLHSPWNTYSDQYTCRIHPRLSTSLNESCRLAFLIPSLHIQLAFLYSSQVIDMLLLPAYFLLSPQPNQQALAQPSWFPTSSAWFLTLGVLELSLLRADLSSHSQSTGNSSSSPSFFLQILLESKWFLTAAFRHAPPWEISG